MREALARTGMAALAVATAGCVSTTAGDPDWARLQGASRDEGLLYARSKLSRAGAEKKLGIVALAVGAAVSFVAAVVADAARSEGDDEFASGAAGVAVGAGAVALLGLGATVHGAAVGSEWRGVSDHLELLDRREFLREELSEARDRGNGEATSRLRRQLEAVERRLRQSSPTQGAGPRRPGRADPTGTPERSPDKTGSGRRPKGGGGLGVPGAGRLYLASGSPEPEGALLCEIVPVRGPDDPVVARLAARLPVLRWPVPERPGPDGGTRWDVGPEAVAAALGAGRE
ncbi:MAG: hypothetical protein L0216_07740 [Planctomycetales bacterium]|nr:hypothetical protein [Planctomycetales bacterium]